MENDIIYIYPNYSNCIDLSNKLKRPLFNSDKQNYCDTKCN